jgi:fatty-acyl-CoA synthase
VVGVADERWGEVGRAYILLRPDAAPVSIAEIVQYCRANLAAYKAPRHVTFVEDFPRTAAGKIRKHLLPAAGATTPSR